MRHVTYDLNLHMPATYKMIGCFNERQLNSTVFFLVQGNESRQTSITARIINYIAVFSELNQKKNVKMYETF